MHFCFSLQNYVLSFKMPNTFLLFECIVFYSCFYGHVGLAFWWLICIFALMKLIALTLNVNHYARISVSTAFSASETLLSYYESETR